MESFVGKEVGKYRIVEQLGTGGMAVVYKAFDTSLERYVAIKFIRKEAVAEQFYPQMLQRFEREARMLASLDHPNIQTVTHTDWAGSVVFSPDGKQLATTSGDATIRLWGVPVP